MQDLFWLNPLIGGVLIGLAAVAMLAFNGRIAGISGIFRGVLVPTTGDTLWRVVFVAGLVAGGFVLAVVRPESFPEAQVRSLPLLAVAGLLVGYGVRLGSGCTSGHGVCGIGRRSPRSIAATFTFIATGAATVALFNLIFGGAA